MIECNDGQEYALDNQIILTVYKYSPGDSFCFLRTSTKNILNLNDCIIDNEKASREVLARLPKKASIDALFTQFGYANWISRSEDVTPRKKSAEEKCSRIRIQEKVLNPELAFILRNEFGWNTLSVSGAFRATGNDINAINSFFGWQDSMKNGLSFRKVMLELIGYKV